LQEAAGPRVRIVRVMPNTPALVHKGAAAYALGATATPADAELTERIFGAVGEIVCVKESLLDVVTGLSGSGPAYIYVVIEALADAGVLMGLPRDLAQKLAAQTVARRLVLTHFYPPVDVVDILGDVAEYYTGPTVLATDGWSIEF
jgi:pyrroline-5-carboxylate reductase